MKRCFFCGRIVEQLEEFYMLKVQRKSYMKTYVFCSLRCLKAFLHGLEYAGEKL